MARTDTELAIWLGNKLVEHSLCYCSVQCAMRTQIYLYEHYQDDCTEIYNVPIHRFFEILEKAERHASVARQMMEV